MEWMALSWMIWSQASCKTDVTVREDDIEGDVAGECSDGADNDRDGDYDCDDSDCESSPDCCD